MRCYLISVLAISSEVTVHRPPREEYLSRSKGPVNCNQAKQDSGSFFRYNWTSTGNSDKIRKKYV